MPDAIPIPDQAAAVERAAKGTNAGPERSALTAAASTLRDLVRVRQSAPEALDRIKAKEEAFARLRAEGTIA